MPLEADTIVPRYFDSAASELYILLFAIPCAIIP